MSTGRGPGAGGPEPDDAPLQRLDPDRTARPRPAEPEDRPPGAFNPRRIQAAVGAFALALVIAFSLYALTHKQGSGTAGVPAGRPAPVFAAPLAASNLVGDANLQPSCNPSRHDPRALNTCLLVKRGPLVLAFFVTGSATCERAVSTLQTVSGAYAGRGVQFAAVAVHTARAPAAAAVRRHRWRIPVAYDADGAVGGRYGIVLCPLLELVRRGGVVAGRLIGRHWLNAGALSAQVATLARQ